MFLGQEYVYGTNKFDCSMCPKGANCQNFGAKWSKLEAEEGWFRATNESASFYRCKIRSHCPGGEAKAKDFDPLLSGTPCINHRTGILCSHCEKGWRRSDGNSCSPCPEGGGSWFLVVLFGVVILFVLWLQLFIILRSGRKLYQQTAADGDSLDMDSSLDSSSSSGSEMTDASSDDYE